MVQYSSMIITVFMPFSLATLYLMAKLLENFIFENWSTQLHASERGGENQMLNIRKHYVSIIVI